MNVITGETGAGNPLSLERSILFWERADTTVLVNKEKCIIEGVLNQCKRASGAVFTSNDLDYQTKSYCQAWNSGEWQDQSFINDTPVTLSQMQQFSSLLVDLHRRFDTLAIADNDFQINVLDAMAEILN